MGPEELAKRIKDVLGLSLSAEEMAELSASVNTVDTGTLGREGRQGNRGTRLSR